MTAFDKYRTRIIMLFWPRDLCVVLEKKIPGWMKRGRGKGRNSTFANNLNWMLITWWRESLKLFYQQDILQWILVNFLAPKLIQHVITVRSIKNLDTGSYFAINLILIFCRIFIEKIVPSISVWNGTYFILYHLGNGRITTYYHIVKEKEAGPEGRM